MPAECRKVTLPPEGDLSEAGRVDSTTDPDGPRDHVLRAKYLDFCSARVAEALVRLPADEIYLLAGEASPGSPEGAPPAPTFAAMVRLATGRLSRTLGLPSYPEFARRYRDNPEEFEAELIGLWKTGLEEKP